jgi:hypothetical protein
MRQCGIKAPQQAWLPLGVVCKNWVYKLTPGAELKGWPGGRVVPFSRRFCLFGGDQDDWFCSMQVVQSNWSTVPTMVETPGIACVRDKAPVYKLQVDTILLTDISWRDHWHSAHLRCPGSALQVSVVRDTWPPQLM